MPDTTVDTSSRIWWTELVATLLLGLAAVGAGWSAYQSTIWNSDSIFAIDRANVLRRQANLLENKGYLLRSVDVGMFTTWAQAMSQGNKVLADFLFQRFRPPMKAAATAWLATKPLRNPNAPPSPFAMKEYRLPEDEQARQYHKQGEEVLAGARTANTIADDYVLVTVPFAVVSLFSGLSTKFYSRGIRMAIVAMALVSFVVAVVTLAYMPVA